jgi:hypothetical protein
VTATKWVVPSSAFTSTREVPSAATDSAATGTANTSVFVLSTVIVSTTEVPTERGWRIVGVTSR